MEKGLVEKRLEAYMRGGRRQAGRESKGLEQRRVESQGLEQGGGPAGRRASRKGAP
jgi:hypothetical protein